VQTDTSAYYSLRVFHCQVAGVELGDANAVAHRFYDLTVAYCGVGVSAFLVNTPNTQGGQFSVFGGTMLGNTSWDFQLDNRSRRENLLSGVETEGGTRFLYMRPGGGNAQTTLADCNVNGTPLSADQVIISYGSAGTLNIIGGTYDTVQSAGGTYLPMKFAFANLDAYTVLNDPKARTVVNCIGAAFDGNPFAGAANVNFATVNLWGCPVRVNSQLTPGSPSTLATDRSVLHDGSVGLGDGPMAAGTAAAPKDLSTTQGSGTLLGSAGAAWVRVPSGTALAAGRTTLYGRSLLCKGFCSVLVETVLSPSAAAGAGGLTTQGVRIEAADNHANSANTYRVAVFSTAAFTLTSDLVLKLRFVPENWPLS
jgi:hypothetical protein